MITSVKIIIATPIFVIPISNIRFIINPSISANQPIIGVDDFVNSTTSKLIPPNFIRFSNLLNSINILMAQDRIHPWLKDYI